MIGCGAGSAGLGAACSGAAVLARWPAGGRGPRLARLKPRFARVRSGDGRLAAVDSAFDKQVVRPADEQQMLGVVAPDDDELAFAVEFERIDDIQAARAVARSVGPDASSEHKSEDVEDQHRGDQKGGDCEQIGE